MVKFRAWVKNLKWLVPVERINFDVATVEVDLSSGQGDFAEYDFNEVELMQYTGLKDRNDVEIYEGDILNQEFFFTDEDYEAISGIHIGEVVIIASQGACLRKPKMYHPNLEEVIKINQYKNVAGYRCKVVGNIYQNKELLEEV